MGSDPAWLAGAAVGFGLSLVAAFTVITFLDNRYTTRREYKVALEGIQRELARISKAVGASAED